MRTIILPTLMIVMFGFGCGAPDDIDALDFDALDSTESDALDSIEPDASLAANSSAPEVDPDFDVAPPDGFGWTEVPSQPASSDELDITPPPSKGTCGGYWERSGSADLQGCGTCTHTIPEPDRPGNIGIFYKRWCWTGGWGCTGCESWQVTSWNCYDNCA